MKNYLRLSHLKKLVNCYHFESTCVNVDYAESDGQDRINICD